jgi:Tol biopolymer transport system component
MLPAVIAFAAAALVLSSGRAAAQYQPHLTFRVLATEHFRVYYHQGQEPLARRLAGIAESVRSTLTSRVRLTAPRLTHVVLANQDDDANGLATPVPYCTIRVNAIWPALGGSIGNTDDWLRLVFVHEFVHILQLNQSVGWAAVARAILGRAPSTFPNLFLPTWQVEGFATYWETQATGLGRLNAGDTAAVVRNRAGLPRGEPLDRVNGGSVEWPGGLGPYLEGAWFYDYLYQRFGEDAVGRLANVTAGRLPFLSSPATKRVFDESLGTLWADFQRHAKAEASALVVSAERGSRLTRRGFEVTSPRFDETGKTLVYAAQDPDGFPALRAFQVATGSDRPFLDRFAGTRVSVRGGLVVFDQLDLSDNVAWRSDLYTAGIPGGRTSRLTSDQRLLEPDVSPDGQRLACVRTAADGRRELVFFTIERDRRGRLSLNPLRLPLVADVRSTYGAPRWSPDGRSLAVERRRLDGPSEIVVFDVADGRERVTASSARTRNISPTWLPDGRTILFASDRANRSFQIYASAADGADLRRITNVPGGALSPEVSPDGRTLVYVGSDATGYDLFALPFGEAAASAALEPLVAPPAADRGEARAETTPQAEVAGRSPSDRGYSPLPTLLPRAWTPLVDSRNGSVRAGVTAAGADVLQRHSVGASLMWRFADTTASGGPHTGRPDWSASYVYSRWRPAFYVAATDTTSFLALAPPGSGVPEAELREQNVAAGLQLPVRHVRHQQLWQAEFDVEREARTWNGAPTSWYRNAFRAAWTVNTALTYGRSVSAEDGVSVGVTSEQVRTAFGADGNADAYTAEARGYWRPGRSHAVLAARAGYGAAAGDRNVRRQFFLGGTSSAGSLVNFGSDALGMVRGFQTEVASGSRIASASVEWRQPLWSVQRGAGTWPVFIRTVHAAVFADAGHTWTGEFSADRLKASFGIEGSLDTVVGFHLPLTFTAGLARTYDRAAAQGATGFYVRIGPSF